MSHRFREESGVGFYIASVLMYVTSIIMLMDKGHGSSEFVVWMSLGSMFLCFGAVEMNKMKKIK